MMEGSSVFEHGREECLDGSVHGFHVEVERKIPILLRTFEHCTLMHITRDIGQHIERAELLVTALAKASTALVESTLSFARLAAFSPLSLSTETSVAMTLAPSAINASAMARPIPWPAALTSASFPFNLLLTGWDLSMVVPRHALLGHTLGFHGRSAPCRRQTVRPWRAGSPATGFDSADSITSPFSQFSSPASQLRRRDQNVGRSLRRSMRTRSPV